MAKGTDLELAPVAERVDGEAVVVVHKLTDMGNAERLADRCADRLRWVSGMGWLWWDGKRWKIDTAQHVRQESKKTVRSIYAEASMQEDETVRKMVAAHAVRSEATSRIEAMIKQASAEPRLVLDSVEQLDAIDTALNVQNGTLSLSRLELVPHDPALLLTKVANASYDAEARCDYWEATLAYFLPDEEVRTWVQMAAGYSMLGSYSEWLFMPYGQGANGKSTFLWALRDVLGDYAIEAAPEILTERKDHSAGADAALADLRGSRLVTTIETREGKRMAEALMKQLTGESRIKAKFMKQNYFEFENAAAVWLATNHKPIMQGSDHAVWRRVRLIPFEVTISDKDRVAPATVKRALRAERDGILRWLVEGLRMYNERGSLDPAPAAVMQATDEYRREMDALAEWLKDRCVIEPSGVATVAEVRESYEAHCDETGRTEVKARRFNQELREMGLKQERTTMAGVTRVVWRGIRVL